ncbi:hypothetical protein [Natrinema versiforme]|nr:hypothetical protein [Natrinema versiforme]
MDSPNADTASAAELPANYTVDVVTPDAVSDAEVDRAIATAWANDAVRSALDDGDEVSFEVSASESEDDIVHVEVSPQDPTKGSLVVADVDIDQGTVTSVDEAVTIDASDMNTTSIDDTDYDIVSADGHESDLDHDDANGDENATQHTGEQVTELSLSESSMESVEEGTFSIEISTGDETSSNAAIEEVFPIGPADETGR